MTPSSSKAIHHQLDDLSVWNVICTHNSSTGIFYIPVVGILSSECNVMGYVWSDHPPCLCHHVDNISPFAINQAKCCCKFFWTTHFLSYVNQDSPSWKCCRPRLIHHAVFYDSPCFFWPANMCRQNLHFRIFSLLAICRLMLIDESSPFILFIVKKHWWC